MHQVIFLTVHFFGRAILYPGKLVWGFRWLSQSHQCGMMLLAIDAVRHAFGGCHSSEVSSRDRGVPVLGWCSIVSKVCCRGDPLQGLISALTIVSVAELLHQPAGFSKACRLAGYQEGVAKCGGCVRFYLGFADGTHCWQWCSIHCGRQIAAWWWYCHSRISSTWRH